jgi:fido (protein-threonine AMPylation protein)
VHAERLVAGLLHVEGYKKIDPQHPLGGPDGKKDVLFQCEEKKWIAASYFPPTQVSFAEIRTKFSNDLGGVTLSGAHGMAFFVNKHLSVTERQTLLTDALPKEAEIFHLERIRALLDSPRGCGLRLEYLRIAMTEEEQWAFWQTMNSRVMETLVDNDQHLKLLGDKIDQLLMRTQSLEYGVGELTSSLARPAAEVATDESLGPTSMLTPAMLTWVHRLVTETGEMPEDLRGRFRSVQVWVGKPKTGIEEAQYISPPPEGVIGLLETLLDNWRNGYSALVGASRDAVLEALARLHHGLLSIHPFFDANGRVARIVIDQAAQELLGMRIGSEIHEDRPAYYEVLRQADAGNLQPLIAMFQVALSRE